MARDEHILQWHAHGHQQQRRAAGPHRVEHRREFKRIGLAEIAMMPTRDAQSGISGLHAFGHGLGHAGPTAKQVDTVTACGHGGAQPGKEIGTVDVLAQRRVQQVARKLESDTVGQHPRRPAQQHAVVTVARGGIDAGRIDETHLRGRARTVQPCNNLRHRLLHRHIVDAHVGDLQRRVEASGRTSRWRKTEQQRVPQQDPEVAARSAPLQVFGIGVPFAAVVDQRAPAKRPQAQQARRHRLACRQQGRRRSLPHFQSARAHPTHVTPYDMPQRRPLRCPEAGHPARPATPLQVQAREGAALPTDTGGAPQSARSGGQQQG